MGTQPARKAEAARYSGADLLSLLPGFSDDEIEEIKKAASEVESINFEVWSRSTRVRDNGGVALVGVLIGTLVSWTLVLIRAEPSFDDGWLAVVAAMASIAALGWLIERVPHRYQVLSTVLIVALSVASLAATAHEGLPDHWATLGGLLAAIFVVLVTVLALAFFMMIWLAERPMRKWSRENPDRYLIWTLSEAMKELDMLDPAHVVEESKRGLELLREDNPDLDVTDVRGRANWRRTHCRRASRALLQASRAVEAAIQHDVREISSGIYPSGPSRAAVLEWVRSETRRRSLPLEEVARSLLLAPTKPVPAMTMCRQTMRAVLDQNWLDAPTGDPGPKGQSVASQVGSLLVGVVPLSGVGVAALAGAEVPEWVWITAAYWAVGNVIATFDPRFDERLARVKAIGEATGLETSRG